MPKETYKTKDLYKSIADNLTGGGKPKPEPERKPEDQKKFNLYTAMGWTKDSKKKK